MKPKLLGLNRFSEYLIIYRIQKIGFVWAMRSKNRGDQVFMELIMSIHSIRKWILTSVACSESNTVTDSLCSVWPILEHKIYGFDITVKKKYQVRGVYFRRK